MLTQYGILLKVFFDNAGSARAQQSAEILLLYCTYEWIKLKSLFFFKLRKLSDYTLYVHYILLQAFLFAHLDFCFIFNDNGFHIPCAKMHSDFRGTYV